MEKRIKEVRKYFTLSQSTFGERIGVKDNTVAAYENGVRNPSESVIMAICREFGVNRSWLESGQGEMLAQTDEEQLDHIALQYSSDPTFRAILEVYMQMSDQSRKLFADYVCQLSDAIRQRDAMPTPEQLEAAADTLDQHDQITG